MQNKGLVRMFAIALACVCLFYLSFSFVTNYWDSQAKTTAQGDNQKYYEYLDSIAGENVWFGYTLKECREKEINLGLDLKGGMNVILEVSVPDILRVLSGYNTTPEFTQALDNARARQATSGTDFLVLFQEEFEKIAPNAQLSTIFSTYELKDRVQLSSSNEEVMKVLDDEVTAAIDNSFNVLRSRIDRFGVVQPNIQRLDARGRILVELPGIKEPARVRKLLQGSANLEFWETFNASELMPIFVQANDIVREINGVVEQPAAETQPEQPAVTTDTTANELVAALKTDESADDAAAEAERYEAFKRNNPLFAVLHTEGNYGPVVGTVLASDTAKVNAMLGMKQVRDLFPRDLLLKWTVKPVDETAKQLAFQLIAIKAANRDGRAPLEGDVITDARADSGQTSAYANVSMSMNAEGAKTWARITKENIGYEKSADAMSPSALFLWSQSVYSAYCMAICTRKW